MVAWRGERILNILVVVVKSLETSSSASTELKVFCICSRVSLISLRRVESVSTSLAFSRSSWIFLSKESKKSGSVRSFCTEFAMSIIRFSKSGSL